MSILDLLVIFASGIATGVIGAMLGVGGGVFIIPILVIALGIPVRTAIAASIIAVIATSSAAAGIYLGSRLSNIRLGMTLETATTIGGLGGGIIAVSLSQGLLQWLFAGILMLTAAAIWRRAQQRAAVPEAPDEGSLGSHYYDPALQRTVRYRPVRLPVGWGVSLLAGVASGLFGIGGGVIKVPAMVLGMRVPTKAAMATSDFMIGVTAVASAFVYYAHGDLDILIAAPAAMGTFLGSLLGEAGRRGCAAESSAASLPACCSSWPFRWAYGRWGFSDGPAECGTPRRACELPGAPGTSGAPGRPVKVTLHARGDGG